jgi:NADPH:quinone reductase-like Zn-dependent oxidoreductase
MKAVRIPSYGPSSLLNVEDVAHPTPAEGEVLIRNFATSVNPFDVAVRAGYIAGYYHYAFPLTLGLDVSGVVEAVGSNVSEFKVGDAVWARTDPSKNGAYAEFVAVAASEVSIKPKTLDFVQAAALPHVGLTAWRALVDTANLSAGQSVLIHGAAGGVGSFAVQLAKYLGARVVGTASTENQAFLRELGVDQAIDYSNSCFEEDVKALDVVFDCVGGDTQERSYQVLKPGGILLSVVQMPSAEKAAEYGARAQFVGGFPPAGPVLKEIAALVDSGKIKPIIADVHPLQSTAAVQDLVAQGHGRGKHILQITN